MSSSKSKMPLSSADKRSKIEAMKEKKAAATAARAATASGKKPAANSGSLWGGSRCASRMTGSVVVLSPPRKVNKDWVFEARMSQLADNEDVAGHMRLSPLVDGSVLAVSPLTDAKGGYIHKYGDNFKKLEDRKPLQLAEHRYTTVKLQDAPDALADWTTPPSLFPGCTVNIAQPAVHSVFKSGVHLAAAYRPSSGSATWVDQEMPRLAFEAVMSDTELARRNMTLSLDMGAFRDDWLSIESDDPTKTFATNTRVKERTDNLAADGVWMTGLEDVAKEGDAEWSSSIREIAAGLVESAAYVESGMGISFAHAANGPTMLVPIPALGIDQSLQDGLPGENGKAFRIMSDETLAPNQLPFFEGTLGDPGSRAIFGSSRNGDGRANGGPWLNLPFFANTMAPGATECISLETQFTLKMSLSGMPGLIGAKALAAIKQIAVTFLPLTNTVVAFEADRNNVASNDKAAETWDCRFSTVDFHSALLQHGIELDTAEALEVFEDAPIQVEEKEITSTFTSSVKPFLACGFVLLNESKEARREDWLNAQVAQMERILKHKYKCTYEIRAIAPGGFEGHKQTLKEFEHVDLETRVGSVDVNMWLVYAVMKIADAPSTGQPAAKKQKKA